jgi:bacterioferritin (cytochrome b1)
MPALAVALALTSAGLFAPGCGGESDQSASEAEKADDIAILNTALGYELAAVDAYTRGLPLLREEAALGIAREFRAQEQEHVNAIVKAIRGLGGRADPPEPVEPLAAVDPALAKTRADALTVAYDQVSAAIAEDMAAVAGLNASWPRALLTSIAANEAQQLTVLRQALGVDPAASVPEAFENGETAPPDTG